MKNPIKEIREYKDCLDWPRRIALLDEYDDSVFFKVMCSCGDDDHNATIMMDYDREIPGHLTLFFYKKMEIYSYAEGFWQRLYWFWRRLGKALKLIFTGYVELDADMVLDGEDHIRAFIQALEKGLRLVKEEESTDERSN